MEVDRRPGESQKKRIAVVGVVYIEGGVVDEHLDQVQVAGGVGHGLEAKPLEYHKGLRVPAAVEGIQRLLPLGTLELNKCAERQMGAMGKKGTLRP